MKILFLTGHYPPNVVGGGEISADLLAQGLVQAGHEVLVLTEGLNRQNRKQGDVKVLELPIDLTAKPLFEKRWAKSLAREIAQDVTGYEIVHCHDFRTALVVSELMNQGILSREKCVVTARDYAQICGSPNNLLMDGTMAKDNSLLSIVKNQAVAEASWLRKPFRIWQYWYNYSYRARAFAQFEKQVFISHRQRKIIEARQNLTGQNRFVVYNPVPEDYLFDEIAQHSNKDLLYAGTIADYKGVRMLLKAVSEVVRKDRDVVLKLVGDGRAKADYEQWVKRNGLQYNIKFLGRVHWERLKELYDETSVVVAPAIWEEPFGRTVVEGMARGRVVVASDVGAPAEIISNNQTGCIFKKGSVRSLVQVLRQVVEMSEQERTQIGIAAREWSRENLNLNEIVSQYEVVYGIRS